MVCYAGKQEKSFWFSSLDQIVQFGAIISCRIFKNFFGQFVWFKKKNRKFHEKIFSKKLHTQKNGPSGASGPASASLWRAEEGTLPSENVNIFVEVVGGTLWKKNKFSNTSLTRPENSKGYPLGFLNIQSVVKHQRH